MRCKVCGAESGKYLLCRECNKKRQAGEIIKCSKCQKWHYTNMPCIEEKERVGEKFLYELKASLVTRKEMEYLNCIKAVLPENYLIQAQANLASFILRTDGARFQNELYRNVDFIITDMFYRPLVVVEINDQTHLSEDRRERDKKVANICEEAGIPIIRFWTSYGINQEYIRKRIQESLSSLPVERVHHFLQEEEPEKIILPVQPTVGADAKKGGCYIATCIYGSYDCPPVWTLRRFRDECLQGNCLGRIFVKLYYAVSPVLVKILGDKRIFKILGKRFLDALVFQLRNRGIEDTPYTDLE